MIVLIIEGKAYRLTPAGELEIAEVGELALHTWTPVPRPALQSNLDTARFALIQAALSTAEYSEI